MAGMLLVNTLVNIILCFLWFSGYKYTKHLVFSKVAADTCVGFKTGLFIETSITVIQNIVSLCAESTDDDEIMTMNVFWVSSSVYMPFI